MCVTSHSVSVNWGQHVCNIWGHDITVYRIKAWRWAEDNLNTNMTGMYTRIKYLIPGPARTYQACSVLTWPLRSPWDPNIIETSNWMVQMLLRLTSAQHSSWKTWIVAGVGLLQLTVTSLWLMQLRACVSSPVKVSFRLGYLLCEPVALLICLEYFVFGTTPPLVRFVSQLFHGLWFYCAAFVTILVW